MLQAVMLHSRTHLGVHALPVQRILQQLHRVGTHCARILEACAAFVHKPVNVFGRRPRWSRWQPVGAAALQASLLEAVTPKQRPQCNAENNAILSALRISALGVQQLPASRPRSRRRCSQEGQISDVCGGANKMPHAHNKAASVWRNCLRRTLGPGDYAARADGRLIHREGEAEAYDRRALPLRVVPALLRNQEPATACTQAVRWALLFHPWALVLPLDIDPRSAWPSA